MRRRVCLLASVLAVSLVLVGLVELGAQAPGGRAATPPAPVRLAPADAASFAKDARARVNVELPDGLELTLWASEKLLIDPVAVDVAPNGTVYVTSTTRNNLPLDIRGHPDWMAVAHTLRSVDALRRFYKTEMAPERSAKNTWIPDLNKDGSRDIRDLAEMKERVYRLRDTDGDGVADTSQIVLEGFNDDPVWDIAGGVLYDEGDLIVAVPPGVYRLRDKNGDGAIDERTTISEGYNTHPTFGGHGNSGVTMGPDGRLYWEVGDMGLHVVDRAGKTWSYPNQGAVMRSEPDGSNFEVFATGLRNLQEFSFDERGNLISVDNDGDYPGENERVVYLPFGSDSGWRSNWQYGKYTDPKNNRYNVWIEEGMFKTRHPGQTSHILPPVAPWHAGPSGMAYNPGTALSSEWRNHFFVSSFPGAANNARIYAFTLKDQGAGFAMDRETVLLRGILTVGMKIGPDGALYLTDWITGWDSKNNGRLWKIDAPGAAGSPERKEVQALLIERFADRPTASVALLLRHADMRVRQKAQFDLVRRGEIEPLVAAARDGGHPLARLHGLWGVAQLARRQAQHAAQLAAFLGDAQGEMRAQAAKMVGDVRYDGASDRLVALLKDPEPRVRFFAAEALGRLKHKTAAPALVEMLAASDGQDEYLHHAGSLALASIGDGAALEALSSHPSRAVRVAALVALRRMRHAGVARFLADADEAVVTDAARAINDDGSIPGAVPALAALVGTTKFTGEPLLRRAINANLREGTSEAVARLSAFAADPARPEELRVEAVAALGVWVEPSPMDRVDGYYLTPFELSSSQPTERRKGRDGTAARAAVQRLVDAAAKGDGAAATADLKVALAEAAGRLDVKEAAPVLRAQLRTDPSQPVRLASLRALQTLKVGNMDELMQIALADKDPAMRRAALAILPGLPMPDAAKVQHLAAVVKDGSTVEKQGAIEVLGGLKSAGSRRLLGSYLDDLTAGRIVPELQVDLLDALRADGSPAFEQKLEAYQKSKSVDTLVKAFREGFLRGGDARRGQTVMLRNPAAECARCHTIRGVGTDVGPDLSKIGATLTREQLLEALVEPNARVAPGFGMVGITLRNGQRIDATLREETDADVIVLAGTPPKEQRIPKADIAERTNPISAMPPLGLILQPREVRDVVEFLTTLK
jgi:putative membrane-bound dehydrogenase-like protein